MCKAIIVWWQRKQKLLFLTKLKLYPNFSLVHTNLIKYNLKVNRLSLKTSQFYAYRIDNNAMRLFSITCNLSSLNVTPET